MYNQLDDNQLEKNMDLQWKLGGRVYPLGIGLRKLKNAAISLERRPCIAHAMRARVWGNASTAASKKHVVFLKFGVPFFGVPILLRFVVYWVNIGVPRLFGETTFSPIILTVVLAET